VTIAHSPITQSDENPLEYLLLERYNAKTGLEKHRESDAFKVPFLPSALCCLLHGANALLPAFFSLMSIITCVVYYLLSSIRCLLFVVCFWLPNDLSSSRACKILDAMKQSKFIGIQAKVAGDARQWRCRRHRLDVDRGAYIRTLM
jgi:hypothetical protein